MGTVLQIADVIVLLMVVVLVPRNVLKGQPKGAIGVLLAILLAAAVIVFATVSLTVFTQLAAESSAIWQGVLVVFLLLMAVLIRLSLKPPTAA